MQVRLWILFLAIVMSLIGSIALGQGMPSSPYAVPSLLRGNSLDLGAPNILDRSTTSGKFLFDQGILAGAFSSKNIPNLQTGYVHYSGKNWRAGYVTLDYILPVPLGENSIVFGEAHSELQTFSTRSTRQGDDPVYLSAGGGYRTMLGKTALVGVSGFYDATRFSSRWLSSGGAGFELAALLPGSDALDMNFNWYGSVSEDDALVNVGRHGPANFDLQAGYSHQLFHGGPDVRLYGTAYKFDDSTGIYGWQTGIELKSPNGVLSAKFETGYDRVNDSYQVASAFVNIGFQVEDLLKGRNPFVMPEPIFNSPRNFSRLTNQVKRYWRHTTHGVLLASNPQTITIWNKRSAPMKIYMGVSGPIYWGNYSANDFPGWTLASKDNPPCNLAGHVLYRILQPGDHVVINFDPNKGAISPAFSADMCPWGDCPQTLGEFTLRKDNKDTVDISLVNGFKYPMEITSTGDPQHPVVASVDSATGNQNNLNIFPLYCDECTKITNPPPWPSCQHPPHDPTQCKKHKSGDPNPNAGDPPCQTGYPMGANYTVYIR